MELKVKEFSFPEVIEFNFEELKAEIESRVEKYKSLVYTEDQIKEAKADLAGLRKFVKALSDERIKIKKECLKPYTEFEARIKELDVIVNEPIRLIDKQLTSYEEKRKEEKMQEILKLLAEIEVVPEWLHIGQIFNDKWLNASVRISAIEKEIKSRLEEIEKDIATLRELPEFSFEAVEEYKQSLDVTKAVQTANKLKETALRKEQAEKLQESGRALAEGFKAGAEAVENLAKATEEIRKKNINANLETKQWVSFKALISTEDALALKQFFNDRNIEFSKI